MSYNFSPHAAVSRESYLYAKRADFRVDAKARKLYRDIVCLDRSLRNLRPQLDINTRDLEKIGFYSTKAKLSWFGSLRRRINEKLDQQKQRDRQIDQIRTQLLVVQIPLDTKTIARREARLAKLRESFEPRIRWKTQEAQQEYQKWLIEARRREDAMDKWKMEQKKRDREQWEDKWESTWQEFLLSNGAKTKVSRGHPALWGSLLL
ncbi:hypothetical protein F25303_11873 [Fusarium sp. NRRL 25303]|nr:hypothetical protein F25303_11873 [Fusarium sp. NRRL 25303]